MFLHPLSAFGRSVDRRGAAKPSTMEILQDGPTGSDALENADHQNAIAVLPPKSHIQPYRIRLGNIDAIVSTLTVEFPAPRQLRFAQIINESGCNGCEATARLSNQEVRIP